MPQIDNIGTRYEVVRGTWHAIQCNVEIDHLREIYGDADPLTTRVVPNDVAAIAEDLLAEIQTMERATRGMARAFPDGNTAQTNERLAHLISMAGAELLP